MLIPVGYPYIGGVEKSMEVLVVFATPSEAVRRAIGKTCSKQLKALLLTVINIILATNYFDVENDK